MPDDVGKTEPEHTTITAILADVGDDTVAAALEGVFDYFNAMEKLMTACLKAGPDVMKDPDIRLAILGAMFERQKVTIAMKKAMDSNPDEARWRPEDPEKEDS